MTAQDSSEVVGGFIDLCFVDRLREHHWQRDDMIFIPSRPGIMIAKEACRESRPAAQCRPGPPAGFAESWRFVYLRSRLGPHSESLFFRCESRPRLLYSIYKTPTHKVTLLKFSHTKSHGRLPHTVMKVTNHENASRLHAQRFALLLLHQ